MDNNQNNNKNPKNNKQNWSIIIITTLVTVFLVLGLYSFMQKTTSKEISYSEFLKMLDDKKIEEVVFDTNQLIITPKTEKKNGLPQVKVTYYTGYTGSMEDSKLVDRLEKADVRFGEKIPDSTSAVLLNIFVTLILPFVLIFVVLNYLMKKMAKGGGMMGVGKSRAKAYIQKDTGITFRDVNAKMYVRSRQGLHLKMLPGRMKRKNLFRKLWISCIIRENIQELEPSFQKVHY